MTITLAELQVLLDACVGSLIIADGATIWRFSAKIREETANSVLAKMGAVEVKVDT